MWVQWRTKDLYWKAVCFAGGKDHDCKDGYEIRISEDKKRDYETGIAVKLRTE